MISEKRIRQIKSWWEEAWLIIAVILSFYALGIWNLPKSLGDSAVFFGLASFFVFFYPVAWFVRWAWCKNRSLVFWLFLPSALIGLCLILFAADHTMVAIWEESVFGLFMWASAGALGFFLMFAGITIPPVAYALRKNEQEAKLKGSTMS